MLKPLHIKKLVTEMLFVDEPELYPDSIWNDFYEAISVLLSEEDLFALEARYGDRNLTDPKIRRQLTEISAFLGDSSVVDEIHDILDEYDNENKDILEIELQEKSHPTYDPNLALYGLTPDPFKVGDLDFATIVDGRPVYIWKHTETRIPLNFLNNILNSLAENGYKGLILMIRLHLQSEIPANYEFSIPYHVIPIAQSNHFKVDVENDSAWVS